MMVSVIDRNGVDTGRQIELSSSVFEVDPSEHAIYLDVKHFLARKRQGTHKSKERSEVIGSTRKIKKQKGTGSARAGDIKNPLFRGGGTVFGPRVRDYSFKLNKSQKQLARKSALSKKAAEGSVIVVEDFVFETIKTKEYIALLKLLKIDACKSLIVPNVIDKNLYLSSRNLKNSKVIVGFDINTYAVLHADKIVLFESVVKNIEERFAK